MKTNTKAKSLVRTHGGAPAVIPGARTQLLRQVSTCMLWEDSFYEPGNLIAKEIAKSCEKVPLEHIAAVAVLAREDLKLRHVPLFLLAQMNKRRGEQNGLLAETVTKVIQRADELTELLAIVSKVEGQKSIKKILSHGLANGIARAFPKFSAYNLAKYNRDSEIKLRDVLFLTHPKPKDKAQGEVWRKLVDGTLEAPDTWEVQLSSGADKKETWERLIAEEKLGGLALLRNLRGMLEAKVPRAVIARALETNKFERVLPFRFLAAMKHAPELENLLDKAMLRSLAGETKLPGRTLLVVDISGSMGAQLSGKSEIKRVDAACALAILLREVCDDVSVYATAGDDASRRHATGLVPARSGMALTQAIKDQNAKLGGGGIFLVQVMDYIKTKEREKFDRVIVFTDEQDCDPSRPAFAAEILGDKNYIVNVSTDRPALILSDKWTRINGFSERLIDWIRFEENQ